MSDTDSFIDEVTEEVRRDRMFQLMKRYGWIAVLAVVLLVGGAAYKEWRAAKATAAAQRLGDSLMAALENANPAERLSGLDQVKADSPAGQALVAFMAAGEEARNGAPEAAAKRLDAVAAQSDLPLIYRQMAMFKSLTFQSDTSDVATRRIGFETLAVPGSPLRLLATEQLALIDIQQGETTAAIDRLQALVLDAEVTAGLRRRASQLIVALGGEVSPPSFGTTTADQ